MLPHAIHVGCFVRAIRLQQRRGRVGVALPEPIEAVRQVAATRLGQAPEHKTVEAGTSEPDRFRSCCGGGGDRAIELAIEAKPVRLYGAVAADSAGAIELLEHCPLCESDRRGGWRDRRSSGGGRGLG